MYKVAIICAILVCCVRADTSIDKRIYTFAIPANDKPYAFVSDTGAQMGYTLDIVREVCRVAKKTCVFITIADSADCWNSTEFSGTGLNNRYWDVCAGLNETPERALVYNLFGEFAQPEQYRLYVREQDGTRRINPNRHITGFVKNSHADDSCLKRAKNWQVKNKRYLQDDKALANTLRQGEVQVAFMRENMANLFPGVFRSISDVITCASKGRSMMVRKDMRPLFDWYNSALQKVMKSGYKKWACNISRMGYGGAEIGQKC